MEESRQEIAEKVDRMAAMLPDVLLDLKRSYPNVIRLEIGLKRKEGEVTDTLCFRIIVRQKVSETELEPAEMLPKEIRGIPTDVLIEDRGIRIEDSDGYDLLTGGIQITIGEGYGTLGCFVTRDAEPAGNKKIYLLSNHHVIIAKNGVVGTRVGQPSTPSGSRCCLCYDIAEVFCGEEGTNTGSPATLGPVLTPAGAGNQIDAAIAKLLGQDAADPKTVYFSNSIEEIGPVFGSSFGVLPGDRVRKRGRTTGLTFGKVETTVGYSISLIDKEHPSDPPVVYPDGLIKISPLAESPLMANEGDSGSAIVNSMNQVIGLLFSVPGTVSGGVVTPSGEAVACRIQNVGVRLGISVMSSGTANSVPLNSISEAKIKPIRAGNYVHAFERRMKEIPEGQLFMQILLDHRGEVMDLINDNREVKLAWHRFNGPEYIGHILKNSSEPKHPVPPEINGYSLQNLLIKMADVLERNGSRRLAKAVDDYSVFAFSFADKYKGIDTLKDAMKNFPVCPKCGKPIHLNAHAH
jgi:hypothetical protein